MRIRLSTDKPGWNGVIAKMAGSCQAPRHLGLRRNVCSIVDHEFELSKRPRTSLLLSLLSLTIGDRSCSPSRLTGYSAVELISLFTVKLR